jgi:branched-chain amino acid transport system permease protein
MVVVHTKAQWALLIAGLALCFALPSIIPEEHVVTATLIGITIIAVVGLELLVGYCGQISLMQRALMGVGAYSTILMENNLGVPFLPCLILAGIIGGLVGLMFGVSSLRVKGLYLALATLAAHLVLYWVFEYWPPLGRWMGLYTGPLSIAGIDFDTTRNFWYLVLVIALIGIYVAKSLVRSRTGRAWIAIRDNENAAEIMGINVYFYKLLAFFIGCFYAGVAGSLFAHQLGAAQPMAFSLYHSILYLGFIIIGGLGSISGAIAGTGVGMLGIELCGMLLPRVSLGVLTESQTAMVGNLLVGMVIILFIIFEHRGIYHLWERLRGLYCLWPLKSI